MTRCLSDNDLAMLADGEGNPAAMTHVAECTKCRRVAASVMRVMSDPALAPAIRGVEHPRILAFVRRAAIVLPFAAALLLMVLRSTPEVDAPHRAPTITATDQPVARHPIGTVPRPASFDWSPVAGAAEYRLTVFATNGAVLFQAEVTDTTVALPDSVSLSVGTMVLWKVAARTGTDRWTESGLVEVVIAGDR